MYYDLLFLIKTEIFIKFVAPLFIVSFILALVPIQSGGKGAKERIDFYLFRLQNQ